MPIPSPAEYQATILAVDDNPKNLQLISSLLSAKNYKVVVANSGENAMKYLGIKVPDLLLLDIMMPGISGYDVLEKIKQNPDIQDLPVIFLTAKSELSDIVKGFSMGAVDYITKPFKSEELIARVETHIELKRMRSQLAEKNAALNQLNKELSASREIIRRDAEKLAYTNAQKDKFFSIISHDLRNPFSGCLMATEMLAKRFNELTQDEITAFIDALHDSATNLNKLLENLLSWAQIQMGRMSFNPEMLDLPALIEDATKLQTAVSSAKNLVITTEVQPVALVADKNMTSMIIRNLFANAVKFTPRGGKISIRVWEEADKAYIRVADTGIGMSKLLTERLFRLNEKVSRPDTDGEVSSGLGLILSHDMAVKMGGSISVESQEKIGSTFTLILPLRAVE